MCILLSFSLLSLILLLPFINSLFLGDIVGIFAAFDVPLEERRVPVTEEFSQDESVELRITHDCCWSWGPQVQESRSLQQLDHWLATSRVLISLEAAFLFTAVQFYLLGMQHLSRSLSRLETQDIKTQLQFNHWLWIRTAFLCSCRKWIHSRAGLTVIVEQHKIMKL